MWLVDRLLPYAKNSRTHSPEQVAQVAASIKEFGWTDRKSPETLARQMKKLEAEMHKRARNLEFEEAARLRDELERLRQLELGIA